MPLAGFSRYLPGSERTSGYSESSGKIRLQPNLWVLNQICGGGWLRRSDCR
jgi:hypothetical protein